MQGTPSVGRAVAAACGLVVVAAEAAFILPPPAPSGMEASDILPGLLFLVAMSWWMIVSRATARRRRGDERTAWMWFAASGGFVMLVVIFLAGAAAVPAARGASLAASAALSVGMYALLFAGLISLARRHARGAQLGRLLLDAAIIAGSLFFILWSALYRDLYAQSTLDVDIRWQMIAYPALDSLLLAFAALTLLGRDPGRPKAYTILLAGLAVLVVTDTISAPLSLVAPSLGLRIFLVGDVAAVALFCVAATAAAAGPPWMPGTAPADSLLMRMLPLFPLGLSLLTAVFTVSEHGVLSPFQFWLAVAVIALVMARFVLTLRQNAQLEAELRVALGSRTQLLRFVSHELANPLSPLTVQAHLLRRATAATKGVALDIMDRSIARLSRLSADMRDLARLESGRILGPLKETDLAALANAAVAAAMPAAIEKGVVLEAAPSPAVACRVDEERVGQVLDNLVGNAIKYTPTGGRVVVRMEMGPGEVRAEVADDGAGLTAVETARLFQPFQRFHTEAAPGLGLGLYLCKSIVEAHGGRIGVHSDGPGQGAIFWFTLPCVAPTP